MEVGQYFSRSVFQRRGTAVGAEKAQGVLLIRKHSSDLAPVPSSIPWEPGDFGGGYDGAVHPLRPTTNRRFNELVGLLILVLAALLLLALVSYHPADPSWDTAAVVTRPANWVGPVGATAADVLFQLFGLASFLLVLGLGFLARNWFRAPRSQSLHRSHVLGLLLSMVGLAALIAELPWQLLWRGSVPLHGLVGLLVASALIAAFNPIGAYLLTVTALLAGLFLATKFSFSATQTWWSENVAPRMGWAAPLVRPFAVMRSSWRNWQAKRQARKQEKEQERARPRRAAAAEVATTFIPARVPQPEPETAAARARRATIETEDEPAPVTIHMRELAPAPAAKAVRVSTGQYKTPPLSLLQPAPPGNQVEEAELRDMAERLTAKCEEFSVGGQVVQINPGPVVTTYEFKPEAGVKYSRITALNDDLCLALAAESVYIERIPGKSTVGIEVPNPHRETIYLREIIASEAFQRSKSPLTMALGKDANGAIVVSDLTAMPHLLIAGSTGSGKSVALNSMIVSLLYKATPDQVRFILVDPKRLELGLYDGIPHLYTPIITEPKQAANALRNATREMERRLKLLASCGVRNIAQYNRRFENSAPGLFENLNPAEENRPLPYIVIVIDELADLMIVDAHNVEESITRLAQMARAVGIHLILATQRPSVDVITGLIKANFPARISFRVATRVDSRTILDSQGAELLLGKGDMLFLPPGTSRFHRVHGAFVTEPEIGGVVENWSKQGQPEMDDTFLDAPAEEEDRGQGSGARAQEESPAGGVPSGEENDPMFEDAVRVVVEYGKASTSLLQRRLRIGYGRAAHLIDLMYNDGIVGPADGPKPREVLKRPDWISEVEEVLR
ncbi:MAG: DNA translocase FtsK [Acidobacteria bacterium]|nr:MAG: DNA translocase FtsK [Acidobacteriota bacterium]